MRVVLVAAVALVPTIASSGFISNKREWSDLTFQQKDGYVMGFMDDFLTLYVGEEGNHQIKQDYKRCMVDMEMRSGDLIEIVDSGYDDLENWSETAGLVLMNGLYKVCKPKIDGYEQERRE